MGNVPMTFASPSGRKNADLLFPGATEEAAA
jgi:hypothetical protein